MSPAERSQIEQACSETIERFGSAFATPYGWAAKCLDKFRPTFADIEKAVELDHLRAHYQMASHSIHADPKGVFFQLGLMDETSLLLTGPSNVGLTDQGHAAAISLVQASAPLVILNPTLDNIIALRIMLELEREVGQSFIEAQERLVREQDPIASEQGVGQPDF